MNAWSALLRDRPLHHLHWYLQRDGDPTQHPVRVVEPLNIGSEWCPVPPPPFEALVSALGLGGEKEGNARDVARQIVDQSGPVYVRRPAEVQALEWAKRDGLFTDALAGDTQRLASNAGWSLWARPVRARPEVRIEWRDLGEKGRDCVERLCEGWWVSTRVERLQVIHALGGGEDGVAVSFSPTARLVFRGKDLEAVFEPGGKEPVSVLETVWSHGSLKCFRVEYVAHQDQMILFEVDTASDLVRIGFLVEDGAMHSPPPLPSIVVRDGRVLCADQVLGDDEELLPRDALFRPSPGDPDAPLGRSPPLRRVLEVAAALLALLSVLSLYNT